MFRNLFETHPVWKKKNVPVCTGAADALHARGPLEVWQSKTLDYCELFSPLAFQSLTHSVCMQSDQGTYRPEDKNSRAWRRGIRLKWRCHPLSFPQVSLQHWCCCLQVVSTLPPPPPTSHLGDDTENNPPWEICGPPLTVCRLLLPFVSSLWSHLPGLELYLWATLSQTNTGSSVPTLLLLTSLMCWHFTNPSRYSKAIKSGAEIDEWGLK